MHKVAGARATREVPRNFSKSLAQYALTRSSSGPCPGHVQIFSAERRGWAAGMNGGTRACRASGVRGVCAGAVAAASGEERRENEGDRKARPWQGDNKRACLQAGEKKKKTGKRRRTRLPPTRSFVTPHCRRCRSHCRRSLSGATAVIQSAPAGIDNTSHLSELVSRERHNGDRVGLPRPRAFAQL